MGLLKDAQLASEAIFLSKVATVEKTRIALVSMHPESRENIRFALGNP